MKNTVLIIGASLAGLSAALAAIENGFNVICVDKKKEVAKGISCAEGVAKILVDKVPFKIPEKYLSWGVDGISFFCDGISVDRKGRYWEGYTINRKGLEEWLYEKSKKKGVEFLFAHNFIGLEYINAGVVATLSVNGGKKTIQAKYIIAADGAQSSVANFLKLGKREIYGRVVSWEFENISLEKPHFEQIFYGDSAPGGYAYIFPKSANSANIGVGSTINDINVESLFKNFVQNDIKSTTTGGKKLVEKSGTAIINRDIPLEYRNILFAGDSASVNLKPFVEGILPSLISGHSAGKSLDNYLPGKYERHFKSILSDEYKESHKFFQVLLDVRKMNSKKFHLLNMGLSSQLIDFNEYENMKKINYVDIKREFLLRSKNQ